MPVQNIEKELDVLIRARYPVLYIVSFEEERVERILKKVASGKRRILTWSITKPFTLGTEPKGSTRNVLDSAVAALDFILQELNRSQEPTLFVLRDFDPFLDDAVVVRKLRDVSLAIRYSRSTLIIVSPQLKVPPHLEKDITVIDLDLPELEELRVLLESLVREVQKNPNINIDIDEPQREHLVKAALGLTADEASRVFAKALVLNGRLDNMDVGVVLSEKKQILRKTGMLEYYEPDVDLSDVGGLDILKDWLRKRAKAFSEKARQFGLPEPRGLLLIGVQGGGKSLCAKVVASLWKLPLLRFDVGAVYGKYVGESEANIRRVIKISESLSPCILWIDELEKAFASPLGGGDSGTSARVFASFLTWLQEKKKPVFVICTANQVEALPPELLRKGRVDEIFFIDLPNERERKEIFFIHLKKRGRDPATFDLDGLAKASKGFSGAEIEQAIVDALYNAFDQERELTTEDIIKALHATVPLSRTMAEQIEHLRDWASTRARPASSKEGTAPPKPIAPEQVGKAPN